MPDTQNSSPEGSVPFVIRGSSSVFSRRQMDIFGGLQALEDAHNKVTKQTKAERNLVKKMTWRATKPAAESLEAEKEARDNKNVSKCPEGSPFKVPTLPPPRLAKRPGGSREPGGYQFPGPPRRDPSKWTYYSLADVDEDGGFGDRGNRKIAADLMRELRCRRDEGLVNAASPTSEDAMTGRILFRPVSGKKRARFVESNDTTPTPVATANSHNFEDDDQNVSNQEVETDSSFVGVSTFRTRLHRGGQRCVRSSSKDSDEERDMSESTLVSSTCDSDSSSDIANDDEDDELEDGIEGV